MICRAHEQLCVSQFEQLLPHIAGENGIPVRNDGLRKSMISVDIVQIQLCNLHGSEWMVQENEMPIFAELVHNYKYSIVLVRLW
jgi:hypothetical protein